MESGLLRLGKDVIPSFSGEGDVVGWIKKVKLVAKLQKVQDLASFIPLFLHGDALALYLEMSNALKNKAQKGLSSLQCFRCRGPHYIKDCTEIPRAKVIWYN